MLKIKKQLPLASIDETEYNKNQEDIKSSIKKLYISNQSKKKTINEYAQLTTQIREEYAKLQAKCAQLENTLQKYKDYVENTWSPPAPPGTQRKRVFRKPKIPYYHQYDNDIEKGYAGADEREDNDEYFDYESKPKTKRKKRIVYVDEIDGDDEDEIIKEPEDVIEKDEDEEYVKVVKKRKKPVGKKPPNKEISKKVGITKSI